MTNYVLNDVSSSSFPVGLPFNYQTNIPFAEERIANKAGRSHEDYFGNRLTAPQYLDELILQKPNLQGNGSSQLVYFKCIQVEHRLVLQ